MAKRLDFNRPRGSFCSQWQGPRNPRTDDRMTAFARRNAENRAVCRAVILRRQKRIEERPELVAFVAAKRSATLRHKRGDAPVTLVRLACLEKEDA